MFSIEDRVEFLVGELAQLENVEVDVFKELVVEFARRWEAKAIVKGLRVISDFEWEFQMNQLNRHLAPEIETVYVMASPQDSFISSSGVKEVAAFGGDVEALVPRPSRAGPGAVPERPPRRTRPPPVSTLGMPWTYSCSSTSSTTSCTTRRPVPLTDQVRIDREEIYDILDQMRATIPEEIKQARWIVKERQEMLAEAKRECDRILGEAREQAARDASQTEIVKMAERQAQDIIEESRRTAREMRLEMEDWADSIRPRSRESRQVPRRGQARPGATAGAIPGIRRGGCCRRRRQRGRASVLGAEAGGARSATLAR